MPTRKWSRRASILLPVGIGVGLAVIASWIGPSWWGGLDEKIAATHEVTTFDQQPLFIGAKQLDDEKTALQPYALFFGPRYLLVSYLNSGRIDLFNRDFNYAKSIQLSNGDGASITGLAADDQIIYTADQQRGEIQLYNYEGRQLQAFAWLPGQANRLRPHSLAVHDGVLYATERKGKQVLAISITETPGLTEVGELLFTSRAGMESPAPLSIPAGIAVTPDGRLLVTDYDRGAVVAFTCNGRYAYRFEPVSDPPLLAPVGIAIDQLPSPELLAIADSVFAPSGIYSQGRIHVTDAQAGDVKVFDTAGRYILSYGQEIDRPAGIAIDNSRRLIVIADMNNHSLLVYKY